MIAILLSSYNGEAYLREQIESILEQTYTDWCLYIRDDGSTDNTLNIIRLYTEQYPNKIKLVTDKLGNLRSAESFMTLLSVVDSDYYMFCDQDDVWLPFKIEITFKKMRSIEVLNPKKSILIFTDLKVVNSDSSIINESMWKYAYINPNWSFNPYYLASFNCVTGCTVMINNEMKKCSFPYSKTALMHDWWIALKASRYGVIDYLKEATILYRQHSGNVVGTKKKVHNYYYKRILELQSAVKDNWKVIKMLRNCISDFDTFKYIKYKIEMIIKRHQGEI
jgi:glycosyltransferase involved in cell wall biosynthesis